MNDKWQKMLMLIRCRAVTVNMMKWCLIDIPGDARVRASTSEASVSCSLKVRPASYFIVYT